ncbi:MAG: NAD-dependent epimerase/dehydratase family protein [Anaerolineales bacterium]|nr:MAG: NAD-dependent epimerase/dehydratase family protein [Anaerolineales bacterium]
MQDFGDSLDWAVLRLSRIYGVGLFTPWGEVVGKFAKMVYDGAPVTLYGDGTRQFDHIHVEDAARAVVRLLSIYPEGWNDTYNI